MIGFRPFTFILGIFFYFLHFLLVGLVRFSPPFERITDMTFCTRHHNFWCMKDRDLNCPWHNRLPPRGERNGGGSDWRERHSITTIERHTFTTFLSKSTIVVQKSQHQGSEIDLLVEVSWLLFIGKSPDLSLQVSRGPLRHQHHGSAAGFRFDHPGVRLLVSCAKT